MAPIVPPAITATVAAPAASLARAPPPASSATARSRTPPPCSRDGIGQEPVLQSPQSHIESCEPAEVPGEHGIGSSAAAWPWKLRRRRLALVLCSARQCAQPSRCAKARSRELLARRLPGLQRADRLGAKTAQPPGVVEQLEALALSLAGARGFARLVDRDAEQRRDRAVAHALGHQPEHAPLELCQLGQELGDDQSVLVAAAPRALGSLCSSRRLALRCSPGACCAEDLAAAALVAVQVQRAVLDPPAQRVAQMLLAVERARAAATSAVSW